MLRMSARAAPAALLLILGFASGASALWGPVTAGPPSDPFRFASPYEVAFSAMERSIGSDHRVPDRPGGTLFFTKNQLMPIAVYSQRSQAFPATASQTLEAASDLLTTAESGWNPSGRYYHFTLDTPYACIAVDTNAWALLAADALNAAAPSAAVHDRADTLAATLSNALKDGSANGVPRCPAGAELPASQWPLPLWALLRHGAQTSDASLVSSTLDLIREQVAAWYDGGFRDPDAGYLLSTNAYFLLVLQAAAEESSSEFASKRDDLARFIQARMVYDEDGLKVGRSVGPRPAFVSIGGNPDAASQLWLAYALGNQREVATGTVPDASLPAALVEGFVRRFWLDGFGSFAIAEGEPRTEISALAAFTTLGPRAALLGDSPPRVTIMVPGLTDFTFPGVGSPTASRYLLENRWGFRFQLDPAGPLQQTVRIPLHALGDITVGAVVPRYSGPPAVQLDGSPVTSTTSGSAHPWVEFAATLLPALQYRLDAYAPVLPTKSGVEEEIHFVIRLDASKPLSLETLRVELDVRNVQVTSVRANDQTLPSAAYEVAEFQATEFLQHPHVRLSLPGLTLRPGSTEFGISYRDAESPIVESVVLARDAFGREALPVKNGVNLVGPHVQGFVRATVRDNVALKSVVLVSGSGLNVTETPMVTDVAVPDVYVAPLPVLDADEPTPMRIVAVDPHGLLGGSATFRVRSQSAFFYEGEPVLLAFSATLFLTAVVIYVKMGRRRRTS